MKTKMRIKFLDTNLVVVKDRLVDADTEFNLGGASESHKGPISLDITLRDKNDVAKFKKYIDQLVGDLPAAPRKVYKTGAKAVEQDIEPIKDMLKDIKTKCKTQDDVIKYLRERNFKFVTAQFMQDREMPIKLVDEHIKSDYQFLIRLVKEGKDPKADKYDPQLVLGIKFLGSKGKFVRVYTYNEFTESLKLPWAEKSDINFKKVAHLRFPHYMIQDERDKYSLEARKLKLNPELKPSKFFNRWKPVVEEFNKS